MAEGAFFFFVLCLAIGAPLVLSLLIARETRETPKMSRTEAEAYAKERSRERYGSDDSRERENTENEIRENETRR